MRVLLDENIPHRFRRLLPSHEVFTIDYLGLFRVEGETKRGTHGGHES